MDDSVRNRKAASEMEQKLPKRDASDIGRLRSKVDDSIRSWTITSETSPKNYDKKNKDPIIFLIIAITISSNVIVH